MKCQIPGCRHRQVVVDEDSGIYSGIYLEWEFCYCNHHTKREVQKAEEEYIGRLVKKNSLVNPFGVMHELGEVAG